MTSTFCRIRRWKNCNRLEIKIDLETFYFLLRSQGMQMRQKFLKVGAQFQKSVHF